MSASIRSFRWLLFFGGVSFAGCSVDTADYTFVDDGGGAAGASGSSGAASGKAGAPAGSGGVSAGSGGVSAGSGGVSAGSGGVSAGSGGVSAGSGGVPAGSGGGAGGPSCVEGTKTCIGKALHQCTSGIDTVLTTCADSQVCHPTGCASPVQLAAGDAHACALMSHGRIYCWGHNGKGQLGSGAAQATSPPVLVVDTDGKPLAGAQDIVAGARHTCARVKVGGKTSVFCWGDDSLGQLGDGPIVNTRSAVDLSLPATVAGTIPDGTKPQPILAAGADTTCAINATGAVSCWGGAQAGDMSTGTNGGAHSPMKVGTSLSATSVAVTETHGCAVSTAPNTPAVCWGQNGTSQLGDGSQQDRVSPASVKISTSQATTDITAVAVGGGNLGTAANDYYGTSCALADYHLRCWGAGFLGGNAASSKETSFATPASLFVTVSRITGSRAHFCAWSASAQQFVCWGSNEAGELVSAGSVTKSNVPVMVNLPVAWVAAGSDLKVFQDPDTGDHFLEPRGFTCVIDRQTPPSIRCVGSNTDGQIGSSPGADVKTFQTVVLP